MFLIVLVGFFIFLWLDYFIALSLIPSLLMSYWIYEDSENIQELQARISNLEKD